MDSPKEQEIFIFTKASSQSLGPNLVCFVVGTEGFFPGVKRPGREPDNSATSTAEVKSGRGFTSNTPYAYLDCSVTNLSLSYLMTLFVARTLSNGRAIGLMNWKGSDRKQS